MIFDEPTSSLDNGDLFFNTGTGKMLVYNGTNTAWEEVQSIGNFFISTLSPAFDGTTQNFTLTNAPTNAEQVLLVINGVVQKPNSGTSTPSEGFALDGSTVKLGAPPATGDTYHAVVIGSTVNIGTPSNNTVTSAILQNGSVVATKIANDAVVTDKIADDAVTADKLANSINTEIAANTAKTTNATHTGEVTGATALTIADDVVDEANLKVSNSPTDGYFLSAQSGNTGGLTWAVVNTDLSNDTSPQLGGNLITGGYDVEFQNDSGTQKILFDASDSALEFVDNAKAIFGTSGDLEIYHDGSHSIVRESGTGNLLLGGTRVNLQNSAGSEFLISAQENGPVELYHDNSKKLETTSSGATITGTCTATAFAGDGSALTGVSAFVSGMIMMYNSTTAPSGWYLCDGNNGTPDLRDRFIVGAGSTYSVGDTGGSATVTVSGTTDGHNTPISSSNQMRLQPISGQFDNNHTHNFSGSGDNR